MENVSSLNSLNAEVAEILKNSGSTVLSAVKNKFVQDEVNRRSELLARLVIAITTFRKEGFKIKADVISFNGDGSVASESWSKAQLDKKKKFDEKLSKAEKAFEKAVNESDYSTIDNVLKELQTKGDAAETPAS